MKRFPLRRSASLRPLRRTLEQLRSPLKNCGDAFLDLLYPPHCPLCGDDLECGAEAGLCRICLGQFHVDGSASCVRCAAPRPRVLPADWPCYYCQKRRYRFHETRALGVYGGRLRDAVLRMKRPGQEHLTLAIGRLLADLLVAQPLQCPPDLLVPTPVHWWRRLLRGANSPDLLTEAVARRLQVPEARRLLYFRRSTAKQGTLAPSERIENVRGAIGVSPHQAIAGRHILVVDDVMTTGATAQEIAKVLLRGGAARVSLLVAARARG